MHVTADTRTAPPDWDARAVAVRGGHVMQSSTWASYRADQGYEPHFLTLDDGSAALALLRRTAGLPGSDAVIRRGPAMADVPAATAGARAGALADWARAVGARSLFLDPERARAADYEAAMAGAGFEVADEVDPSIHVMRLDFPSGLDPSALETSFSKSTRQRIRAARQAGTSVQEDAAGSRLEDFAGLLQTRAEVVGMRLQAGIGYVRGWQRLVDAGLARLLIAEHEGELVGGLFLFRQGGIHATAYSADRAERRRDLPGTMHLVRATAIADALAEGCAAIELGGVDLPGHRRPPEPGEPNRGLYEHKRGFGAHWLEREPARRIVLRPGAERLAGLRRRVIDLGRRVGR
jgi:lipid II:glycine glycyltransferase (peptidoglycan interpeptide bridge formation enzyme)